MDNDGSKVRLKVIQFLHSLEKPLVKPNQEKPGQEMSTCWVCLTLEKLPPGTSSENIILSVCMGLSAEQHLLTMQQRRL